MQRFALYMLDYHGVLVSVWAILSGVAVVSSAFCIGVLTSRGVNDDIFNYVFLAFGLIMFLAPPITQFKLEKSKKFTKYKILQIAFAENPAIKYIAILSMFVFTYWDCRIYFSDGNVPLLVIKLLHEPFYVMYFVTMCCYTRDRDPPYKTYTAFSPT
jgi:hypothetical protein